MLTHPALLYGKNYDMMVCNKRRANAPYQRMYRRYPYG